MAETSAQPRPPLQHALPPHQASHSVPLARTRSTPVINPGHPTPSLLIPIAPQQYLGSYMTPPYSTPLEYSGGQPQYGSSPGLIPPSADPGYSYQNVFSQYPQPYPQPPFHYYALPTPNDSPPKTTATFEPDATSEEESIKTFVKPPPRPPNAWILYRSDRLRDIAEKKPMPGLDAVMAESGLTTGESQDEGGTRKKKVPKPKKGSKTPSEGMLSLGKGKTGRGIPQADVSKLISLMWARESNDVKKFYERQSELQKIEHQRKYPDYKFQPLRKADKLKLKEERDRAKAEVKRQKEMEKQAGKAKRRGRNKLSPVSPEGGGRKAAPVPTEPEHVFSANPFPMHASALPSLPMGRSEPAPPQIDLPGPQAAHSYAYPFVFEAIPTDGLSLDDLPQLDMGNIDAVDPTELAAVWANIEADVAAPLAQYIPTEAATRASESWYNLPSTPPAALPMSSGFVAQLGSELPELYYPDAYQYDGSQYLELTYPPPEALQAQSGPFLYSAQPLSPLDSGWQNPPHTDDRVASSSGYAEFHRHISSSSFPATPLSVETAGWSDRTTSFSAIASQIVAEGVDAWDEPESAASKLGSAAESAVSTPSVPEISSSSNEGEVRPPVRQNRPRTIGQAFSEQSSGA